MEDLNAKGAFESFCWFTLVGCPGAHMSQDGIPIIWGGKPSCILEKTRLLQKKWVCHHALLDLGIHITRRFLRFPRERHFSKMTQIKQ